MHSCWLIMTKGRDNIDRPTRPHFKEAGEHPERAGRGNEDDQMLFIKFPKKKIFKNNISSYTTEPY